MDHHILYVLGGNLAAWLFLGGMAYARLKQNGTTIAAQAAAHADTKTALWTKFDALNSREERHYRKLLVAITALASTGNPHPNEQVLAILERMSEESHE